jgi:hypothetical protein
MSSVTTTNILWDWQRVRPSLWDGASVHRNPGTSCLATIRLSLREKGHSPIEVPRSYLSATVIHFLLLPLRCRCCEYGQKFRCRRGLGLGEYWGWVLPTSSGILAVGTTLLRMATPAIASVTPAALSQGSGYQGSYLIHA